MNGQVLVLQLVFGHVDLQFVVVALYLAVFETSAFWIFGPKGKSFAASVHLQMGWHISGWGDSSPHLDF